MNIPEYDGIGIYKITNPLNGKVYIGASKNVMKRIMQHKGRLRRGTCNAKLKEDINHHELFKVDVIEKIPYGVNTFYLHEREKYYVDKYDSIRKGYNIEFINYSTKESLIRERKTWGYNKMREELLSKWDKPITEPLNA